jgi:dTDP-4-dehydrorhamnose 3,5-epimerase
VDVRRSSPRFGQWIGLELSAENHRQLWLPPGFAHGFLVLSSSADVFYKASAYYAPESEAAILWNDNELEIAWPIDGMTPVLSAKDSMAPAMASAIAFE